MIKIKQRQLINRIVQKYSLELILFFGSRISGKIHKESDFDIAYLSKKDLKLTEEAQLICDLMPIFKSEKIDLVNLKKASPFLLFAITNDCQVLYEKDSLLFPSLRVYAFKQYIETKFLYEEKFKRLQERIKKIKLNPVRNKISNRV